MFRGPTVIFAFLVAALLFGLTSKRKDGLGPLTAEGARATLERTPGPFVGPLFTRPIVTPGTGPGGMFETGGDRFDRLRAPERLAEAEDALIDIAINGGNGASANGPLPVRPIPLTPAVATAVANIERRRISGRPIISDLDRVKSRLSSAETARLFDITRNPFVI